MASFLSKQSGSVSFSTTDTSKTAALTSVDTTKAFVRFNWRTGGGATGVTNGAIRGIITDATTVTFTRASAGSAAATLEWTVMEWSAGVTVESGSQTGSGATTNVTITEIDTTKAWPIVSMSTNAGDWNTGSGLSIQASITSTTNLALVSDDSTPTAQITCWQIVEYDNATVALYSKTIARNTTGSTQTITSVDTTKTILFNTMYGTDDPSAPANWPRWTLTNATTVTWVQSSTSNGNLLHKLYVVSFSDEVIVQKAVTSVASGTTTSTITVTSLTVANTLVHVLGYLGTCSYTAYATVGFTRNAYTLLITNATTLTYARTTSGTASTLSWETIEFPSGTPPVTPSIFIDHATGRGIMVGVCVGIG
jgi:hypothetical protein